MTIMDLLNIKKPNNKGIDVVENNNKSLNNKLREKTGRLADLIFSANPQLRHYTPSDELKEHGITQNRFENMADFNLLMARRQSALAKVGDSIVRTIGDTALDTGAGFADMLTMPYDLVNSVILDNDNDYQNPISTWLNEQREKLDQNFKIYRENNTSINNGGLLDYTYYLDNIPSLFSSLSMLIPSKAVTWGIPWVIGKIGKASKAAKTASLADKLNKANKASKAEEQAERATTVLGKQSLNAIDKSTKLDEANASTSWLTKKGDFFVSNKDNFKTAADVVANATLSRMMENYQEARGVYNNTYKMALDRLQSLKAENPEEYDRIINDPEFADCNGNLQKVAKSIANKSADEDFKSNLWNLTFDIIQFAGLHSLWKGKAAIDVSNKSKRINKEITDKIVGASKAAKDISPLSRFTVQPIKNFGKKIWENKGFIASQGTEGVEEIINYISEQEGNHVAKTLLRDKNRRSDIDNERLLSYFNDGQLWDSAFWGFLGGMLFGSVGDRIANYIDHRTFDSIQEQQQKEEMNNRVKKWNTMLANIQQTRDGVVFDKDNNPIVNEGLTPEKKQQQITSIINDFITDTGISEAQVGNLQNLRTFINDDRVRQLLVNKGVITEEESKSFMESLDDRLSKVENLYNKELLEVNHKIQRINGKIKGIILPQYANLIATRNVRNRLNKEVLENELNGVNQQITNEQSKANLADATIYDSIISALDASSQISALEERKKSLSKNKKLGDDVELLKIQDQIDFLKQNYLTNIDTPVSRALLTLATNMWKYNPVTRERGINMSAFESLSIDDFRKIDSNITDEDFKSHRDLFIKLGKLRSDSNSNQMYNLLRQKSSLRAGLAELDADYFDTHNKLARELDTISGLFNEALRDTLDSAVEDMVAIAKKYNKPETPRLVQQVLQDYLNATDKSAVDKRGISDEDFDALISNLTAVQAKAAIENNNSRLGIEQHVGYLMSRFEAIDKLNQINEDNKAKSKKESNKPISAEQKRKNDEAQETKASTEQNNPKDKPVDKPKEKSEKETIAEQKAKDGITPGSAIEYNKLNGEERAISFYSTSDILVDDKDSQITAKKLPSGNYVLNADKDDYILNSDLYNYSKGFDINKPFVIKSSPYVSIIQDTDGTEHINVITKGCVINTEEKRVKPKEEAESSTEGIDDTIPATDSTESEVDEKRVQELAQAVADKEQEVAVTFEDTLPEIRDDIKAKAAFFSVLNQDAIKEELKNLSTPAEKEAFIDSLTDDVIAALKSNGISPDAIASEANIVKTFITDPSIEIDDLYNYIAQATPRGNTIEKSIITLDRKLAFRLGVNGKDGLQYLDKDIKKLLTDYSKRIFAPSVNGKYYINIRPLFRYTDNFPKELYFIIKDYVRRHPEEFTIVDDVENISELFEPTVYDDEKFFSSKDSIRIDIFDVLDNITTKKGKEDFWNLFDSLQKGQEVEFKYNKRKKQIEINVKGDNRTIGFLTVPGFNKDTSSYTIPNDGLLWTVMAPKVGKLYEGAVPDMFRDIFDITKHTTDPDYIQLRSDIYTLSFDNISSEDKTSAINRIIDNPVFNKYSHLFVKTNKATQIKVIDGLVKATKYIVDRQNMTGTLTSVNETLNTYFGKKFRNWQETKNIADNLNNGKTLVYNISHINEGKLVKTDGKFSSFNYAGIAIANLNTDVDNPNSHRIGVVDNRSGYIIAGASTIPTGNGTNKFTTQGNTFVAMPARGRNPDYVTATRVSFSSLDANLSKTIVENLVKPYRKSVKELFNMLGSSDADTRATAMTHLKTILCDSFSSSSKDSVEGFRAGNALFTSSSNNVYISNKSDDNFYIAATITTHDSVTNTTETHRYGFTIYQNNSNGTGAPAVSMTTDKDVKEVISINEFINMYLEPILNQFEFNIDGGLVSADTTNKLIKNGIVERNGNGKFLIHVPHVKRKGKSHSIDYVTLEYNSFNEFILGNNLLKVDLKRDKDTQKNYTRSNPNDMVRASIEIQANEKYVENQQNSPLRYYTNPIGNLRNKIIEICNSNEENKGVAIIDAITQYIEIYDNGFRDRLQPLLDLINNNKKDFFLLPKNIKFVGDDSNQNNILKETVKLLNDLTAEGALLGANIGQGETIAVGNNWLSMIDYRNLLVDKAENGLPYNPGFAITTLVHERLHDKFRGHFNNGENLELRDKLIEVYNDFAYAVSVETNKAIKEGISIHLFDDIRKITKEEFDSAIINPEDDEDTIIAKQKLQDEIQRSNEQLEEFLIRSLTSYDLMNYLNSVYPAPFDKETPAKKSIWQKLIEAVCELFGFKITPGSILHKEYLALGEVIKEVEDHTIENRIKADSQNISEPNKYENRTWYEDKTTGTRYGRVTTSIKASDNYKLFKGEGYELPATSIGTSVDEFVRDFFEGKLDTLTPEELQNNYPNTNAEDWDSFRKQLNRLKEYFDSQGITIIPHDVTVTGTINMLDENNVAHPMRIAGTLDLLGRRGDDWFIFDMKTIHVPNNSNKTVYDSIADERNLSKWNMQLNSYKKLIEEKYNIKVKELNIIPIAVNYDAPKSSKNENGVVYELANSSNEVQRDRTNPNRNQLLADGEKFLDAAPQLLSNNDDSVKLVNIPIQSNETYKLSTLEKNFLEEDSENGKATYEEYLSYLDDKVEQDAVNVEDTSEDIDNTSLATDLANQFGLDINEEDLDDSNDDIEASPALGNYSINTTPVTNSYDGISAFLDMFDSETALNLRNLIDRGEISLSCK